ncbi:MAG: hypothetical protein H0U16_07110 [Actinobacteria bacterium]|nr:hypothetical protein [Actinomycetota bacterium]
MSSDEHASDRDIMDSLGMHVIRQPRRGAHSDAVEHRAWRKQNPDKVAAINLRYRKRQKVRLAVLHAIARDYFERHPDEARAAAHRALGKG